jgi:hypothetical protein
MSLTEPEVLDRLRTSLAEAIQASKDLAVRSRYGLPYQRLRDHLALIEGCCRQMAAFRGDGTWLPFGIYMAECHKRAGGWLRGYTSAGIHITYTPGQINQVFVTLAAQLTAIKDAVETKSDAKTGQLGPVLPATPTEERRVGRPAFGTAPKSKLILPRRFG